MLQSKNGTQKGIGKASLNNTMLIPAINHLEETNLRQKKENILRETIEMMPQKWGPLVRCLGKV